MDQNQKIWPKFYLLLQSILIFLCHNSIAQKVIQINDPEVSAMISPNLVSYFQDKSLLLTFDDIQHKTFSYYTKKDYNLGYSPDRYWFKYSLKNNTNIKDWLLVVEGTLLDEVWIYVPNENGTYHEIISGDNYPKSKKEINCPLFVFNLSLSSNIENTFYIAVQSNDTKQFKMYVSSPSRFFMEIGHYLNVYSFYFGMLLMLFLYNLLLYFSIRNIMYLYYVLYILSFGLLQFTIVGFGNQYIWGNYPWMSNHSTGLFTSFSTLFITLFAYKFLNIKLLNKKLLPFIYYLITCSLFILLLNLLKPHHRIHEFNASISLFNTLIVVFIGSAMMVKGYKPAKYYMLAWGILFISIVIYILHTASIITHPAIDYTILPIGAILEATILSFALGKRINEIEKDNASAHLEIINQMQEKEKEKTRIARDLHDDLGSTVSSIRYMSEMLKYKNDTNENPQTKETVNSIISATQNIQETLHDIVWTTQASEAGLQELIAKLSRYTGDFFEMLDVEFSIQVSSSIEQVKLTPAKLYNISMIYKEAINNISKHADSTAVEVKFDSDDSYIYLSIKDNGKGFDSNVSKEGNGLKNMSTRCAEMNGTINIESQKNGGTSLLIKIPF